MRELNPAVVALYRAWSTAARNMLRPSGDGEVYDGLSTIHDSLLAARNEIDRLEIERDEAVAALRRLQEGGSGDEATVRGRA